MNIHLAYFLTALGETLAAYAVMAYFDAKSDSIHPDHVIATLLTIFIAAYSGFYILDALKLF